MAQRDWWSKADILSQIVTPFLLFYLGFTFNEEQKSKAESQQFRGRLINLGKSLSSANPVEQKFAMAMLKREKSDHPDDFPDELLALAAPGLINLATESKNADIADQAKSLVIDLATSTKASDLVKGSVSKIPARIYFHIPDKQQKQEASDANTATLNFNSFNNQNVNVKNVQKHDLFKATNRRKINKLNRNRIVICSS